MVLLMMVLVTDAADLYDDATNFEDLHYADCAIDGFTNDDVDYHDHSKT